jgi:hypothetical protein
MNVGSTVIGETQRFIHKGRTEWREVAYITENRASGKESMAMSMWHSGGSHGHTDTRFNPLQSMADSSGVIYPYSIFESKSGALSRAVRADRVPRTVVWITARFGRVLARFRANSLSESVLNFFFAVSSDTPPAFSASPVSSVCVRCLVSSVRCPLPHASATLARFRL